MSRDPRPIRIVNVDADAIAQAYVRSRLKNSLEVCLAGEACGAVDEAVELCRRISPSVAILPVDLPRRKGVVLYHRLQQLPVAPKLLFTALDLKRATLLHLHLYRPTGILLKDQMFGDLLVTAVLEVASGRSYMSPAVREGLSKFTQDPLAEYKILSDCEITLLPWIAKSASDEEIAAAFEVKKRTIAARRSNIARKLGMHNTRELVAWTLEAGYGRYIGEC